MKTKITLLIAMLFLGLNATFAQTPQEEDLNTLSIFSEYAKAKNYDAAYGPWMELRQRNPKFNRAIFTYGERILNHKIENSSGSEKVGFINDLVKMWDERRTHFASKTPQGEFLAKAYYSKTENEIQKNLNTGHKERIIEVCFDYMINDEKIAPKAYSMNTLWLFGRDYYWIHPELALILERDFQMQSSGFKARARHILKKIKKSKP